MVKNLPASEGDTRDMGSVPGLGGSPGEENGNLDQLHYEVLMKCSVILVTLLISPSSNYMVKNTFTILNSSFS